MNYYETVQKAVDYIEMHLKEEISLSDIAQHVNFSEPHVYRIFKGITDETIKSYIMKRRLSAASIELKSGNKKISEIAYEYGFESHDVFTRAFLRVFNISPSRYRNSNVKLELDVAFLNNNFDVNERRSNMNYNIIKKDKIIVIGMECKAIPWDKDGAIGRLWSSFLDKVDLITCPIVPNIMYGIVENETCNEDSFTYMAGIEVNERCLVPEGMVKRVIRQQKFIQAEVPEDIRTPDAYTRTFEYAKQNGYTLDNNDEIEVYEEVFKDPFYNAFKLLIPIK